jgi:hypothetical protein
MEEGESSDPQRAIDEIVAAVVTEGALSASFPLLGALKPWLEEFARKGRFDVETVSFPRSWLLDIMNDGHLLEYVTMKPWEQITDDMRVRHVQKRIEEYAQTSDEFLALQEIRSRACTTAVVASVCSESSLEVVRILGAWPSQEAFWTDHLHKNVDAEFPPTEEEILRQWDHYAP